MKGWGRVLESGRMADGKLPAGGRRVVRKGEREEDNQ